MEEVKNADDVSSGEESVQSLEEIKKRKRKLIPSGKPKSKKMSRKLRLKYENLYKKEILSSLSQDLDENERELEHLVFGGEQDVLEQLEADTKLKKKKDFVEGEIDDLCDEDDASRKSAENVEEDEEETLRLPAWEDEDDEKILVNHKLKSMKKCRNSLLKRTDQKYETIARENFLKITGEPSWAELKKKKKKSAAEESDENDDEGNLTRKTGRYFMKSKSLPKGKIDVRRCQNLMETNPSNDIVTSAEFHPTSKVAVVGGVSGIATLFQIDGKNNPKIQAVRFEKFPLHTAHFSTDGCELLVSSKECSHYFLYDMIEGKINKITWEIGMEQSSVRLKRFYMSPDGKLIVIHGRFGKIHIVSARSKEWIQTLKMNGEVIASTFNADGSKLYTHGDNGQIYVWDMNSRLCIHKFVDEGCLSGTALALSYNGQYLATGSDCGVVNIYDESSVMTSCEPKPLRAVMNLTTEISSLKFNRSSEILAVASRFKSIAVKLVHFPSMAVFSNFPFEERNINIVNSIDFSPNSGYMLMGNNTGKALLYRLRHYENY